MSVDPELISAAVHRNDAAAVRELLRDATEADRRACARALRPLLRGPELELPEPIMLGSVDELRELLFTRLLGQEAEEPSAEERARQDWFQLKQGTAFLAAALGLAGGVAAAVSAADDDSSYDPVPDADVEAVAGVLADRRPPWLADFAGRRLSGEFHFGFSAWLLARQLVRMGAITRPDVPGYTLLFPGSLDRRFEASPEGSWRPVMSVADALLADPGLLEDEVWRLFTVPDVAWTLQQSDFGPTYDGEDEVAATSRWSDGLAELSERGHLDRGRLIDAALDAFTRDFAPNRVAWYAAFHDRMGPTEQEMAARADRYLGLLAVGSKPGVTLGQRGCGRLLDAGLLAPERFLAASGPSLIFPQKSVATAQLKLCARIVARHPGVRGLALATAAQAFGHQREDVQEAALKLIARHGLPADPHRAAIRELTAALSPSLARDAAALGLDGRPDAQPASARASGPGTASGPALDELERRIGALPAGPAGELRAVLAAARRGGVPGPARVEPSAGRALPPPLTDPEELVQLLAQLMEDATDALAVERALAGAVRLAALPAADRARLAAPLVARAGKLAEQDYYGPFSGREIAADLACVALAWGTGWSGGDDDDRGYWGFPDQPTVDSSGAAVQMAGILSARAREAAGLIAAGRPVQLLAEPDAERGAISPGRLLDCLARRAGSSADPLPRHDLEVALLRLAPGAGESFWSEWERLHPASADAARRAYRESHAPLRLEPAIGEAPRQHGYSEGDILALARIAHPPAGPGRPAGSRDPGGRGGLGARGKPGGRPTSRCWALLTDLVRPLRDHRRLYPERWARPHYAPVVAAWPLLCPWQPELAAAHLLRPLSDGLTAGPAPATIAVRCLASSGHPLGPIGHLALVAGLASAESDTRITAAEVWAQAALDGRLHPELAASAIVAGVTGDAFKLSRIADGLQHAAPEPLAGYRIVETAFAAADALIPARPPGLHLLYELAVRTSAAVGQPALPAALTDLATQRSSSKLAAAARRLAASAGPAGAAPGPVRAAPDRGQVVAQALAALIARAESA